MKKKKPVYVPPSAGRTAREIERLVTSPSVPDLTEEDVTCRLSEMFCQLVGLRTQASGALAREVYMAVCRAWQRNRRDIYGEVNMLDHRERATVEAHGDLLDAVEGARKFLAVPDPWPTLGGEWERFVAEVEGGEA